MERDARFLVDLHRDHHPVVHELGQHYLVDTSVLNASIELAGDISEQHILEIGCGPGSLTHHLIRAGARVSAIERFQPYFWFKMNLQNEWRWPSVHWIGVHSVFLCGWIMTLNWPAVSLLPVFHHNLGLPPASFGWNQSIVWRRWVVKSIAECSDK